MATNHARLVIGVFLDDGVFIYCLDNSYISGADPDDSGYLALSHDVIWEGYANAGEIIYPAGGFWPENEGSYELVDYEWRLSIEYLGDNENGGFLMIEPDIEDGYAFP